MFKRKTKALKIHRLNELQPMVASGRPVLINFFQVGCAPCQVMDGIVNELAREYGETAHVVKADVGKVPGAIETYKILSLIHISEPTRPAPLSRMPSSA